MPMSKERSCFFGSSWRCTDRYGLPLHKVSCFGPFLRGAALLLLFSGPSLPLAACLLFVDERSCLHYEFDGLTAASGLCID